MGDCLWSTSKPSRHITSTKGDSAFHFSGIGESSTARLVGILASTFTCVRWQVSLCDLIWQVTLRSTGMLSCQELYHYHLTILSFNHSGSDIGLKTVKERTSDFSLYGVKVDLRMKP